jgi:hypothetical protein
MRGVITYYCSPNIIRMVKSRRRTWAGNVAGMREKRNTYRVLVGTPEGKRPRRITILVGKLRGRRQTGRPWHRWKDSLAIYLKEIVCEKVE